MKHTLKLLTVQFGPLMTSEEVARVLKFPTVPALRAALRRKRLALVPVRVPSRKQHLFATEDVANCVIGWGQGDVDAAESPVGESDKEAAM